MIKLISPNFDVRQDGVTIRVYHANKGQGLPKHEHKYSHLTFCHSGSILIRKENKQLIMTKDTQPVNLIANEWHEIEALDDNTIFVNIFSENKY